MSKTTLLIGATAVIVGLAACGGSNTNPKPKAAKYGFGATAANPAQTDASPSPTPMSDQDASAVATPTPAATPAASTNSATLKYGTPVPNKPGFVTSPYSPYSGYVDVRGFPPGTEVKDPYTGKVFLVP
ncbi:MAG: hypothetical protein ABI443_06610 [Chthoniobacterales bacterium]